MATLFAFPSHKLMGCLNILLTTLRVILKIEYQHSEVTDRRCYKKLRFKGVLSSKVVGLAVDGYLRKKFRTGLILI